MTGGNLLKILLGCTLALFCISAGCTGSTGDTDETTTQKIEQVQALSNSASASLSVMENMNIRTVDVGIIRTNASAANRNQKEALEILDRIQAEGLDVHEQANLKLMRAILSSQARLSEMYAGPYADYIENMQIVFSTDDPTTASAKWATARAKLQVCRASFVAAYEELDAVDTSALNPEDVEMISETKAVIRSRIEMTDELLS